MRFTKMEGLGNDYLYLNCMEGVPEGLPQLAVRLSDRHFGVGADGLVCIRPGKTGDFTMEMYNADGSRGAMCGNGIRCMGKYVYDHGLTQKTRLAIDTDAGLRQLELVVADGEAVRATVDMGEAVTAPAVPLAVEGHPLSAVPVSVGNPHAVIFCADPEDIPLERWGAILERHPALGQRRNIEFVSVPDRRKLCLRVWERGSGVTLACGTGACAAFSAAWEAGRCESAVRVCLPGGVLELERRGTHILLTGPARTVFEGETVSPLKFKIDKVPAIGDNRGDGIKRS
jgi:diaminopimelate epimerase